MRHDNTEGHHVHRHHEGHHHHNTGEERHGTRSPLGRSHHHHEEHHAEENSSDGGGRPQHGGRGGGHRGGHGGHFGGPRGRARRGEARYVLLDTLRDGPKHGYEIIKFLEDRSGGEYAPSPGTVYPTMQYLQDLGQVRSDQNAERRDYHLTEIGLAELEARAEDLKAFWSRFANQGAPAESQPEIGFLREELDDLGRTAWGGLKSLMERGDTETIRRIRQTVERCRSEIREIMAESLSQKPDVGGVQEADENGGNP